VRLLLALLLSAPLGHPESIPECSTDKYDVPRAVLTHLGGCARPTRTVRGLLAGLGKSGAGWSLALATDEGIRNLRKRGCPTAMVCTSGNELAVLQQTLPPGELSRKLSAVKARARPALREGAPDGQIVPWE
jgi:hypothetical protein